MTIRFYAWLAQRAENYSLLASMLLAGMGIAIIVEASRLWPWRYSRQVVVGIGVVCYAALFINGVYTLLADLGVLGGSAALLAVR